MLRIGDLGSYMGLYATTGTWDGCDKPIVVAIVGEAEGRLADVILGDVSTAFVGHLTRYLFGTGNRTLFLISALRPLALENSKDSAVQSAEESHPRVQKNQCPTLNQSQGGKTRHLSCLSLL